MSKMSEARRAHIVALDAQVFHDDEWTPCTKCGGTGDTGGKTMQANDIEWPCEVCTRWLGTDAGPLAGLPAFGSRPGWVRANKRSPGEIAERWPMPVSWSERLAARTQMERAARQFIAKPTTGNQEALARALEELDHI